MRNRIEWGGGGGGIKVSIDQSNQTGVNMNNL